MTVPMVAGKSAMQMLFVEGKEMLAVQLRRQESVERRTAELLRLTVATLGGIVVIFGFFISDRTQIRPAASVALAIGVICTIISSFVLARILVGRPADAPLAYGPDLRAVIPRMRARDMTLDQLTESLLEVMPDWLADNDRILARQRTGKVIALAWLALGASAVLLALVYIWGGRIFA